MTDDEPTPEDLELAAAKEAALVPPEIIPDAADLPDDVRDGDAHDHGEDDPDIGHEPVIVEGGDNA